jgi:hypothetical protein
VSPAFLVFSALTNDYKVPEEEAKLFWLSQQEFMRIYEGACQSSGEKADLVARVRDHLNLGAALGAQLRTGTFSPTMMQTIANVKQWVLETEYPL